MAKLENSTMTIKTAAAVMIGVLSVAGSVSGAYWAAMKGVEVGMVRLESRIEKEEERRMHADEMLELKIANNTRSLDDVRNRVATMGTVTTFR